MSASDDGPSGRRAGRTRDPDVEEVLNGLA